MRRSFQRIIALQAKYLQHDFFQKLSAKRGASTCGHTPIMKSSTFPLFLIALLYQIMSFSPAQAQTALTLEFLRCEYRHNPLGIDATKPRLSWRMNSSQRGARQTAYQILVASTPQVLAGNRGDVWDSKRVESDASQQIEYAGAPLKSRQLCWWKVRVWDENNRASTWSAPARWSMGLLKASDWQAQWIGYDAGQENAQQVLAEAPRADFGALRWIQKAGLPMAGQAGSEAKMPRVTFFRHSFDLPNRDIKAAHLALVADQVAEISLNGKDAGKSVRWETLQPIDVKAQLQNGNNQIVIRVTQHDGYAPAILGELLIEWAEGAPLKIPVDASWQTSDDGANNWGDVMPLNGTPWGTPQINTLPLPPVPYLRREFNVSKALKSATLSATALGVYEMRLNGARVGGDELTPGWTDYHQRVQYQTYDVSAQIKRGQNAIGALLGEGWYAGNVGYLGRRYQYGGVPRLMAQIDIEYADGTHEIVGTDENWRASFGALRHADLLMGSDYDATRAMPGWDTANFDAKAWQPVSSDLKASAALSKPTDVTAQIAAMIRDDALEVAALNSNFGDPAYNVVKALRVKYTQNGQGKSADVKEGDTLRIPANGILAIESAEYGAFETPPVDADFKIEAANAAPSRVQETIAAKTIVQIQPGVWLCDLGQNITGHARLQVTGKRGQRVTVRHGERLNPNGTLYTSNLRGAAATDFYTLREGAQKLEAWGTFHGFQYLEISGLDQEPQVTGIVVYSQMDRSGDFSSSNTTLNRLFQNIIWGQKGNYLEVPTDCPQRDERLGWTGDAQFFINTAALNFDVAPFMTRWLNTLIADSQNANGSFANVAPVVGGDDGSVAWGDAALICAHALWKSYGDKRIIATHYAALQKYFDYPQARTKDGISKGVGFGDWLHLGKDTSWDVIGTSHYAYLCGLMSEMAAAIGKDDDARHYRDLQAQLTTAFQDKLMNADGSIKDSGQTGYALAFTMDLVPEKSHDATANQFVEELKATDWHLATGFIGTPRLLPALHRAGRDDIAYRVLLQDTYPSWLAQVNYGATTMWERWNGWTPDKGFESIGMNSFNHYAFGAVGEYLYEAIGGIKNDGIGYQKIRIQPIIRAGLTWAKTHYDSNYGRIATDWKVENAQLQLKVTIPANTSALVYVPDSNVAAISESGRAAGNADGVKFVRNEASAAVFEVGAGEYHFVAPYQP